MSQSQPARQWAGVFVLALVALLFGPSNAVADPPTTRVVVVLYPESSNGSPGNALVDQSIRATFAAGSHRRIDIYNEYLDVTRFPDGAHQQLQADFLRRKYADRKVDLVIAGLSSALDFALQHRQQLFPGVPIVFCAVAQREVQARKLPPDVIGTPAHFDLTGTLELALRLHPQTQRVFVVAGKAPFDITWEAAAWQSFQAHKDRLEFVYLTGLPLPELLKKVAELPERSIIYYLSIFQDGSDQLLIPAEVVGRLAAVANAPIYGHVDTFVGLGVVGGSVFRFETAGNQAALLGLRLLAGEKAENIGVQPVSANTHLLDWRQLQRWGISEDSLPPGSVVQHREPDFWELYKWPILGALALVVIESLLILGLLVQRSSLRRAEQRFRQVIEAAPTGMIMVGQNGTIALVNPHVEKLFGYSGEDMIGQPVEMLLPERFRTQHPAYRNSFFAAPEVRPMGVGRELFGQHQDGSEFPVEIGLSPVRTGRGLFVLASIVDITERRQVEDNLRANQRELRELSGRLLQAQETERGRIARELHDDLQQSLALLAVQLDMLGQKPPESATQLSELTHELSAQVKRLSTSVHDLSHQLHPAKLEQLGLLAAVRGLCKELMQSHGLPIAFTHDAVPEAISADTALCLYRIAQEALQNVIRHSGAQQATVELRGDADTIGLRIVDDGNGFDLRAVEGTAGLGLVSMPERLRLVGGELVIDTRPGEGTRIEVHVPVIGACGTRLVDDNATSHPPSDWESHP